MQSLIPGPGVGSVTDHGSGDHDSRRGSENGVNIIRD